MEECLTPASSLLLGSKYHEQPEALVSLILLAATVLIKLVLLEQRLNYKNQFVAHS